MNGSMALGGVLGENRLTGCPFLSIKNLVNPHLISSPKKPACFSFKNVNNGAVRFPLMEIFLNRWPKHAFTSSKWVVISSPSFSGIVSNWSHGKHKMSKSMALRKKSRHAKFTENEEQLTIFDEKMRTFTIQNVCGQTSVFEFII